MKHFLDIADLTQDEIQKLLDLSVTLKEEQKSGKNRALLKNKVLAMVFQKPSLRTRVSFDMAIRKSAPNFVTTIINDTATLFPSPM